MSDNHLNPPDDEVCFACLEEEGEELPDGWENAPCSKHAELERAYYAEMDMDEDRELR